MGRCERRIRQPRRRRDPDPVPIAAHVLGRDPALLSRDTDRDRTPIRDERLEPLPGGALAGTFVRAPDTRGDLRAREVAEPTEEVVDGVGVPRAASVAEPLEGELDVVERAIEVLGRAIDRTITAPAQGDRS